MTDHCAMADPFHRALCRGGNRVIRRNQHASACEFFADPAHPQVAGRVRKCQCDGTEPLSEQIVNGQA